MEPYIKALVSIDRSDFSIGTEKLDTKQVVEKLLGLAKEVYTINKDELTEDSKPEPKDNQEKLKKEIEEYAQTHKVDFDTAYRAIFKKNKAA